MTRDILSFVSLVRRFYIAVAGLVWQVVELLLSCNLTFPCPSISNAQDHLVLGPLVLGTYVTGATSRI